MATIYRCDRCGDWLCNAGDLVVINLDRPGERGRAIKVANDYELCIHCVTHLRSEVANYQRHLERQ